MVLVDILHFTLMINLIHLLRVYNNHLKNNIMKKVFLMLAFAGLVGSVSASVAKSTGDDDKGKNKKECKKEGKACCKDKTAAEGKACSGEKSAAGEKKSCCKDKAKTMEAKPAETK